MSPQEVDWLDQDLSPRLDAGSVQAGLSEGPVLVVDLRPSQPESVLDAPEFSVQVHNPRKNTQKRYKSLLERRKKLRQRNVHFKAFWIALIFILCVIPGGSSLHWTPSEVSWCPGSKAAKWVTLF